MFCCWVSDSEPVHGLLVQCFSALFCSFTIYSSVPHFQAMSGKPRQLDGRRVKIEWPDEGDFVEKEVPEPQDLLANLGNSEEVGLWSGHCGLL